ncbi:MAG: HAD family phosphatase [Planctomycetes bacterium]|nr:HAD family phosphatase [Planctomycetota bacterium]
MTSERRYDAVLLDLDGTLLDQHEVVRPRNAAALRRLVDEGVHVMITTGRSVLATLRAVDGLDLPAPMAVFNGAAIYCPVKERLLEERVLSNRAVARALAFAEARDLLVVCQTGFEKFGTAPRDPHEDDALRGFLELEVRPREELPREYLVRIVLFSRDHARSADFRDEVVAALDLPSYLTHFPLRALVRHAGSPLHVVDVHPPCLGKAEALRWLTEERGVAPGRVVAIGDAGNDVPMLRAAGLGVAMGNGHRSALEAADRVIGAHDTDAIAELVDELF